MLNHYMSLGSLQHNASKQTLNIIRNIRLKTEIELTQNIDVNHQVSFRKPKTNRSQKNIIKNDKESKQSATIFFSEGLKYEGTVENQKFDGFGIISKDGIQLYVGSFNKGSFHGFGRLMNSDEISSGIDIIFQNWLAYSGQFKHGLFHGMGTIILQNGQKFLGRFNQGKLIEQGILYKNNKVFVGQWN